MSTIFPGGVCIGFNAHKACHIDCREPTVTVDGMRPKVSKELANTTKRLLSALQSRGAPRKPRRLQESSVMLACKEA